MKNKFPLTAASEKEFCAAFNVTHFAPRIVNAAYKMVIAIFTLMAVLAFNQLASAATLVSDSADYGPGEEAILTGSGFQAGETVTLQVLHADGSVDTVGVDDHLPWDVVSDENGDFVTSWHVCEDDCVGASLIASADGQSSGLHAETTFTDAGILRSLIITSQVGTLCESTSGTVTIIFTITRQQFANTPQGGSTFAPLSTTVGVTFCLANLPANVTPSFSPSSLTFLPSVTVQTCTLTLSISSLPAGSRNFGIGAYVSSISTPGTIDVSTCTSGPNRIVTASSITINPRPDGFATVTDAPCHGYNGSIDATVTDGTSPFSFSWSNGATTEDISAIAGTYTFTVTDANGCTIKSSETIHEPAALETSAAAIDALCNGSNGSIDATITGGTTPYNFSWSNGATTEDLSAVAGTYTLTVTDANGCTATTGGTISEPPQLTVDAGEDEETYFGFAGDQTVTHTMTASGGTGSLSYSYTLLSYEIIGGVLTTGNPRPLICNAITTSGDEKFYSNSGSCSDASCPGTGPNTSLVSPVCGGPGANKITLSLLDSAIVVVTVTDENGCTATDEFIMFSSDVRCFAGNSAIQKLKICHKTGSTKNPCVTMCIDSSAWEAHEAHGDFIGPCPKAGCSARVEGETSAHKDNGLLIVYPNPNAGEFNIEFSGASKPYELTVTNIFGQIVYSECINDFSGAIDEQLDLDKLADGSYYIQIRNDGNLYAKQIVVSH